MIEQEKIVESRVDDKGIRGIFEGYDIELYNPKPDEVIVWKFKTAPLDLEHAKHIFEMIQRSFPNNTVIGIPDNTSLEVCEKEYMIKFLQDTFKQLEETK